MNISSPPDCRTLFAAKGSLARHTFLLNISFQDTDTLYIEFKEADAVETRDLDQSTILDLDAEENIISIIIEHTSNRTDVHQLTLSGIAA